MKENLLGLGLTLLTVALWVGPIVAAFGAHNWSVKETLAPNKDQINEVENRVEGLMGENEISEDIFSVSDSTIEVDEFPPILDFSSPFNFPLTITKFNITILEGGVELGSIWLEENVEVGASETKPIPLSGTLTKKGEQRENVPTEAKNWEGTLEFESSGVTFEISLENMTSEEVGGGSSDGSSKETTKR